MTIMTPKEFHEACHEAICSCPQFQGYDDDQYFQGFGEFSKIPKKGMLAVIKFWRKDDLLWGRKREEEREIEMNNSTIDFLLNLLDSKNTL